MADNKEATEGSLADRLTNPDGSKFESPKAEPAPKSTEDTPAKSSGESTSWADEVETPVKANPEPSTEPLPQSEEDSLPSAQLDGATEPQHGTPMVEEPSYEVNVKLSDVQADPNNPLYSIKTFEELGVYVLRSLQLQTLTYMNVGAKISSEVSMRCASSSHPRFRRKPFPY